MSILCLIRDRGACWSIWRRPRVTKTSLKFQPTMATNSLEDFLWKEPICTEDGEQMHFIASKTYVEPESDSHKRSTTSGERLHIDTKTSVGGSSCFIYWFKQRCGPRWQIKRGSVLWNKTPLWMRGLTVLCYVMTPTGRKGFSIKEQTQKHPETHKINKTHHTLISCLLFIHHSVFEKFGLWNRVKRKFTPTQSHIWQHVFITSIPHILFVAASSIVPICIYLSRYKHFITDSIAVVNTVKGILRAFVPVINIRLLCHVSGWKSEDGKSGGTGKRDEPFCALDVFLWGKEELLIQSLQLNCQKQASADVTW